MDSALGCLTKEKMITFFRSKKTRISCIEDPQTLLNQLRDSKLVPEELYRNVMNMKNKKKAEQGMYDILDWVETNQGHRIKQFWSCVFENHILQKYPIFYTLKKTLLDEKKKRISEVARDEKKQGQKKIATKRKKSGEETGEEKSGASSVTIKKIQAKKPKTSPLLKGGTFPDTCRDKKGTVYPDKLVKGIKRVRSPELGTSSVTSKKKPATKRKISPQLKGKTLLVTSGDKKHTLYPDKPGKEVKQVRFPGLGASSVASKKPDKKPKISPRLKGKTLLATSGDKKRTLYPDKPVTEVKQVRFPRLGASSVASKKPDKKPKISPQLKGKTLLVTSGDKKRTLYPDKPGKAPWLKGKTLLVTSGDKKRTLYPDKPVTEVKQVRFPGLGASSVASKKPDKKPKISPQLKRETLLFTGGAKKKVPLYPDKPVTAPQLKNETLSVTCGDKTGTLYPDKLAKGELCILSEDTWFTPNEFERFSGREKSKNWKQTIRCQNTPLLKLIKEGHLLCPHKRSRAQKCI